MGELGPDALTAPARLLSALADSGDIAGAVAGGGQLLRDMYQVCGRDRPMTKQLRDDLARWGRQMSG
ncbi:hypothetical protein [Nocardia sp. NPDC052112]|uniref:hypothetical protein n=1 Tax=Nocardia sp. NPDC052112 TaxID=3155646 RepID=UPI0034246A84